ncbi:HAD family hydrolase [Alkalimarinus alittae]|uniref:HAD family hydrolase n=1 Tax=Alkalimarinus alittae TaxID=2961619 RepID=A0ABY6N7B6_9ALTE|nr:HAD family hydrolase [Alkalimarinus alittae]UZE97920.1 HAD family hydrolase [Alkalimarinus alittae]
MLKALFFDMDETLCDTQGANEQAQHLMGEAAKQTFANIDGQRFAKEYVTGIYREWSDEQRARYMPIIETKGEGAFRLQLIRDLLADQHIDDVSDDVAMMLQEKFDADRIAAFSFYPGIADFLIQARKLFTLVVITNGPEFSQIPKVEAVNMADYVDHIIIGGQEPEQKPAASIFEKALTLANCQAHEVVHVGDSLAADIVGAHNSGITSVWIQHQQPLDAELGINPHHTVMHPSEIPAFIRNLHESSAPSL